MLSVSVNNRRIAKNTLLLYIRMFLTMAVMLYTSRIVLNAIAIQHYLTFELGRNDFHQLQKVFNTSLSIHVFISVLYVLMSIL